MTSTPAPFSSRCRALALGASLALAAASFSSSAEAEGMRCRPDVEAWVERAARETGAKLELRECHGAFVRVAIVVEAMPPLVVELARGGGPAFRRAGDLRLSPVMNGEWTLVPAPQRSAFDALVAWTEKNPDAVVIGAEGSFPSAPGLSGLDRGAAPRFPFRVAVALGLVSFGLIRARRTFAAPRRVWLSLAALFVVALVLRFSFGFWGPFHINGQGPLWVDLAWRGTALPTYGSGYRELFHGITKLGPPDTSIFLTNVLLSSLTPVLAALVARLAGAKWIASGLVGGALALDPLSTRFSATETYFVPALALLLASLACACAARLVLRDGQRAAALSLALGAGVFAAQLFRLHPVFWPLFSSFPLLIVGVDTGENTNKRIALRALFVGALFGLAMVLTLGSDALGPLAQAQERAGENPKSFDISTGVVALVAPLALAALAQRSRKKDGLPPRARLSLAGVGACLFSVIVLDELLRRMYGQSEVWQRAFDTGYLILMSISAAGLAAPRTLKGAAVFALPLAFFLAQNLWRPIPATTELLEYRWLRAELARLEADAVLMYIERHNSHVLTLPEYALRGADPSASRVLELEPSTDLYQHVILDRPLYYVHSSLCSGLQAKGVCEGVERHLELEPISRLVLPAVASHEGCRYEDAEVEITISRVKGLARH